MNTRRSEPVSRSSILALALLFGMWTGGECRAQQQVTIDATAPATPFPHFWEQMFGSGRAILSLRESYRNDLRAVRQITGLRYVRFHGVLDEEVGVYNEDEHGNPVYNFAYVDEVYDGLLKNGVRPVVEISFMPKKLAFNPDWLHPFWYKPNVSPPKSWEKWDGLITALARHLIERYGVDEVAQWYFEVWNEPNIDFWGGIPRQKSYFELYDHTARDLKSASSRLRVGGPATAAATWVEPFLEHTAANHVAVDFVSTHGYADDTVENLFGTNENIPMDDRVCRAIAKVKNQIHSSASPTLPLLWTEWNVPGMDQVRDTSYVGPAVANTVRECDGLVDEMSFWTFSDVFEEDGPISQPFEGHFGLRAKGGINKPSYYDFALLHKLGDQRIANSNPNLIVTRRSDGTLLIAVWNLVDPGTSGSAKRDRLVFENVRNNASLEITRVDNDHGNTLAAYRAMGSPRYLTEDQIKQLNTATQLSLPEQLHLEGNRLDLDLEPNALVLVQVNGSSVLAAAGVAPATIDAIFKPLISPRDPGAAVMVRQDGRTAFLEGYGVCDLHAFERIGPATNFRLASVTKQFTAMAVMLLVHAGKLRYTETIEDLFPDFPKYGRDITIRELLTHTSGLPDYEELMGPQWTAEHQIDDEEVLDLLKRQSARKFKPGSSWAYSNSGYVLLGLIVGRVSGEPFANFLQEHIFNKLHMTSTVVYVKGRNQVRNRAYGYSRDQHGEFVPTDQSATSATLGDGGVYSNLLDLAKWDDALRNRSLLDSKEMSGALTAVRLSDASIPSWPIEPGDDNLNPGKPVSYGFGWFLDPYQGHARTWHSGATSGFRTVIDRFTQDKLSIVVLSNRTDLDPTSLALRLADTFLAAR